MKFFININQAELTKLAPDATIVDGAILDYIYWVCNTTSAGIEKSRITFDNQRYTWINYDWLIKEMPLLKGKSKGSLTPIFRRLEEWGFIKTYGVNGGKKYVAPGDKLDLLHVDKPVGKYSTV